MALVALLALLPLLYMATCVGNKLSMRRPRRGVSLLAVPTPPRVLDELLALLGEEKAGGFTFLDLGCGAGETMRRVGPRFREVWGVELDPATAQAARELTPGARIWTGDFSDPASPLPSPETPTVVFVHEPLFKVRKKEALRVYSRTLDRIRGHGFKVCYLVYVSGLRRKDLLPLLRGVAAWPVVHRSRHGAWLVYKDVVVYRVVSRSVF